MIDKIKRFILKVYTVVYLYLPIVDLPLVYIVIRGM